MELLCASVTSKLNNTLHFSFRFQKKITRPLTKIIQFTKILSTIEEGGDNENAEKMTIDDIPEGIYQSKELVKKFKEILFGMNKKESDNDALFHHNLEKAANFPYNELHHSSPFSKLIDWEPMIDKLRNKDGGGGDDGGLARMRSKYSKF